MIKLILLMCFLMMPLQVQAIVEPLPINDIIIEYKHRVTQLYSTNKAEVIASYGNYMSSCNSIGSAWESGTFGVMTNDTNSFSAIRDFGITYGLYNCSGNYFVSTVLSKERVSCPDSSILTIINQYPGANITAGIECNCVSGFIYYNGVCANSGCSVNQTWDWDTETCKDKPVCLQEDDFVESLNTCVGCRDTCPAVVSSVQHTGWDTSAQVCLLRDSAKVPIPGTVQWCPSGYQMGGFICVSNVSCATDTIWNGYTCVACAEGEHLVRATKKCESCDTGMSWDVDKQKCGLPSAVCGGPGLPACKVDVQNACGGAGQPACQVTVVGGSSGGSSGSTTCGGPGQPVCEIGLSSQGTPGTSTVPSVTSARNFDNTAMDENIKNAKVTFQEKYDLVKTNISSVLSLNLGGSGQLPQFGPWEIMGKSIIIDLNVFAAEMVWIRYGLMLTAGIIGLGVIFRK